MWGGGGMKPRRARNEQPEHSWRDSQSEAATVREVLWWQETRVERVYRRARERGTHLVRSGHFSTCPDYSFSGLPASLTESPPGLRLDSRRNRGRLGSLILKVTPRRDFVAPRPTTRLALSSRQPTWVKVSDWNCVSALQSGRGDGCAGISSTSS